MHPEVKAYLDKYPAPQSIDILVVDGNGILRGKQYPGDGLEGVFKKGLNFPLSMMVCNVKGATPDSVLEPPLTGDPDRNYKVVEGSLRPVPWAKVPTAQVMLRPCEKNGDDLEIDPRTVLERVVKRLNDDGYYPTIALEGEFYLLDPTTKPPSPIEDYNGWPPFEGPQVYALEPLRDVQGFLDQIKDVTKAQSIPMTAVICEYGVGQFEANLNHSNQITDHCQDFLMLKHSIRCIAANSGQLASFMAKPVADQAGSGCHIHVSIMDKDGNNIFGQDEQKLLDAIGGLMDSMQDQMAVIAPFANSYRRFTKEGWSPNAGNWGHNHRLVSLRIPLSGEKDKRVEHRTAGADTNPFLLTACVLAGIHHGLKNRIDPGPESMEGEVQEEGIELPARWREAIAQFDQSKFYRENFGDAFVDMYCRGKYSEEESFHLEVSDRDLGWCLRTV